MKDVHGETIPGVTVLIKGTGYGTVTDDNGVFKAEFYGGENVVLKFSFIGMKSKELVYSGQKDIEVILEEDVAVMNDDDIDFNMVFYWGYLLTQTEKIVYENAKMNNIELDFEDIKDIASDILDDDAFNDDITNHLKNYDKEQEL